MWSRGMVWLLISPQHRNEPKLESRIEAYIQSRMLKITFESLAMDVHRKLCTKVDADKEEYVGMKKPIELNCGTGHLKACA